MKCPNCREKQVLKTAVGDCMELTDLPSELLYRTLDTVRERLRIHVKTAHENVLNTLDTFNLVPIWLESSLISLSRVKERFSGFRPGVGVSERCTGCINELA